MFTFVESDNMKTKYRVGFLDLPENTMHRVDCPAFYRHGYDCCCADLDKADAFEVAESISDDRRKYVWGRE